MSPINSARNAPVMAPIPAAIIRSAIITVAVAWIGVTVSRIRIRRGVDWVSRSYWISRSYWVSVPWAGTDVDAHALGGCFERYKHRQAKSNGADKKGG
jgi:hypothetical protein